MTMILSDRKSREQIFYIMKDMSKVLTSVEVETAATKLASTKYNKAVKALKAATNAMKDAYESEQETTWFIAAGHVMNSAHDVFKLNAELYFEYRRLAKYEYDKDIIEIAQNTKDVIGSIYYSLSTLAEPEFHGDTAQIERVKKSWLEEKEEREEKIYIINAYLKRRPW